MSEGKGVVIYAIEETLIMRNVRNLRMCEGVNP